MSGRVEMQGPFSLPPEAKVYRTIGPFDGTSLPKGLLREHRLKAGSWARLRVLSGEIRFVWDDADREGEAVFVGPGATVIIPPAIGHHLELTATDVLLEIEFLELLALKG